jgi:uncharacterized SAM-binding protein YcdF (DUF218 family)
MPICRRGGTDQWGTPRPRVQTAGGPRLVEIIKALVLPPGLPLLLALIGLAVSLRWRRAGVVLAIFAVFSLYLLCLVPVSKVLLASLEATPPVPESASARGYGAIVVLGAGRYPDAPEYSGDTVSAAGLERLRYAARLRRETGLPLLVSGGSVYGNRTPEAVLMNRVLQQHLGGGAAWLENASTNTMENAEYSARLLRQHHINRIYLVTHAVHMRRALRAFERQGLDVTPAPTVYGVHRLNEAPVPWFIPTLQALTWSRLALYKRLGMLWYFLRYQ